VRQWAASCGLWLCHIRWVQVRVLPSGDNRYIRV
jgi:hypothetical protein